MPVELSASLLPVRFASKHCKFQPYVGIGVGDLIPVGDNNESFVTVSPRIGMEFYLGKRHVLGFDVAYHAVTDDSSLDYVTCLVAYRFRIPFGHED